MNRAQKSGTTVMATAIRGEEREHHGQGERGEKEPADAVKKRHREKDDHRGERGGQHGQRHFASALFRGDFGRFAQFHVPVNIFQHDDRIIDQARKGERQAAQDHAVDGTAAER